MRKRARKRSGETGVAYPFVTVAGAASSLACSRILVKRRTRVLRSCSESGARILAIIWKCAGKIPNMTGINSPYEAPYAADYEADTTKVEWNL